MTKKLLITILVVIIAAGAVIGGIFAWRYWQTLKQEEESGPEVEVPADWKTYRNEEWGIAFSYPPEWGEVTNYLDEFGGSGFLPEEYRENMKKYGEYLVFSNFDNDEYGAHDWAPQIRISSAQKIKTLMSEFVSLSKEKPEEAQHVLLYPLLGVFISNAVLMESPQIADQFTKMIEDIAKLSQGASVEVLKEKTQSVFFLFASGLRYAVETHEESGEPGEVIGVLRAGRSQIVTTDGNLQGVIEIGSEGWDVAARDYWDCILTIPEENNLIIYVSFTLELPTYEAWGHPIEWSEGKRPPETEELMERQIAQFEKFAKNIRLLEK